MNLARLTAAAYRKIRAQADGAHQFLSGRRRWEAGRKTAGIQPACLTWPVPGILRRIRLGCPHWRRNGPFIWKGPPQRFVAAVDPKFGPPEVKSAAPDPGTAAQGRCPVIRQRGFGTTRQGWEALREQLHAEARWRGLSQAAGARVLGDGAVCFWGLAEDRWPQAGQRLDYWHAVEQLAAVSRARFGKTVRRWRRGWSR